MKYYKYQNNNVFVLEVLNDKINDLYYNVIKVYNIKEPQDDSKTTYYRKNTIADTVFEADLKEYIAGGFKPLNTFISSDGYKLVTSNKQLGTLFLVDAGYIKYDNSAEEPKPKRVYRRKLKTESNETEKVD